MTFRLGHIGFLNCYPIYYGLREGGATEPPEDGEFSLGTGTRIRLVPGVPTDLNRMLAAGTIDFGPISSIAYARHHRSMAISSRLSISSRGAVDSIQLVTRRPLEQVEQVALTPKSATSVVLLKVILSLRYGIHPRYEELEGDVPQALEDNDAVLLIGDEALEAMYYPESDTLRYDLGVVWREWTGLPMVYAVWAARAEYMGFAAGELLDVEEALVRATDYSRTHMEELVKAASDHWAFGAPALSRYFGVLKYGFDSEYRRGLERFYQLAYEAGELSEVPEIRFLEDVAGGTGADKDTGAEI